ncbi:MAG TPA: hypothetical protein VKG26_07940 [Bacteroidia bacterium]|nr:hypothetical protein [Bacteroidia bacterium]
MSSIKTKEKDQEEDFIHFTMRRKNACKYFMYTQKLEKIFEQEKLIGAKSIYHKLIDLFVLEEDELENLSFKMTDEYTGKVISRFAKDKAYNFEVKRRVQNERYDKTTTYIDIDTGKNVPKTIIQTYSSQEMIRQAVNSVVSVSLNKEGKKYKKEEIIRASYINIINYVSKDKELSEIISHYKATVIAGYIAMEFGFTLSADLKPINIKEIPPTNEQIYNAVKYFTDPLNTANKKKKHK